MLRGTAAADSGSGETLTHGSRLPPGPTVTQPAPETNAARRPRPPRLPAYPGARAAAVEPRSATRGIVITEAARCSPDTASSAARASLSKAAPQPWIGSPAPPRPSAADHRHIVGPSTRVSPNRAHPACAILADEGDDGRRGVGSSTRRPFRRLRLRRLPRHLRLRKRLSAPFSHPLMPRVGNHRDPHMPELEQMPHRGPAEVVLVRPQRARPNPAELRNTKAAPRRNP